MSTLRALLVAAAGLPLALPAPADVLIMRDGRLVDGVEIEQGETTVTLRFENGTIEVPLALVENVILEGGQEFVPRNQQEREAFEKGLVPFQGKFIPERKRDQLVEKLLEEKRAEIEQMKKTRDWRNRHKEETENFAFESTVPRHVFESYRDLFEEYFGVFVKMWKIKKPRDLGKLKVQFFIDHEDFMQVTGMPPRVGGFFRFVDPFELAIFYDPTDPRMTEEVIYHELGHYLQKLIEMDFKYPHWPGESISEYYGASNWDPVEKELTWGGLHESRISQIKKDIESGKWVHVEPMIRGANDRNFEDYFWGWSFVHYLLSTKKYEPNFKKFIIGLARARDVDRETQQLGTHRLKVVTGDAMLDAFMRYMKLKKPEDLKQLEREWHAYIEEELTISSWRGLAGAASLAYRQDRVQRAKRLYQEAVDAGADSAVVFHRYANVLASDDMHKSAHERWKQAVELDPLIATFYIAWGADALSFDDTRAEGERMLRLARELDPDNYYLERNMEQLLKRKAKGKLTDRPERADEGDEEDEAADGASDGSGSGAGGDGGGDGDGDGDGGTC